jgi:hypothetical protein
MGIYSPLQTAELLGELIDARIQETGGLSPIEITGDFRADGMMLEWDVTFRLLDPATLIDLRGTFVAMEDDVPDMNDLYPRVTRVIHYEPVALASPGDSAHFVVTVPQNPEWDWTKMRSVVFLQQTIGSKPIIQGAVLSNVLAADVAEPAADLAMQSRILGVAPNPFSAATEVSFQIAEASSRGPVLLEILDPLGRRVRELPVPAPARSTGRTVVAWDGASDAGEQVPVGSYFVRLTTPDGVSGGRAIRVR